jgi:DedD protein
LREETGYRVTGILFLLAVAIICLPMLLDGAGLPARRLPDLPMQDTLPEVQPLATQAPESDFVARVEQLREQVDEDGFLTDSGTRFGEPVLTPEPVATPEPMLSQQPVLSRGSANTGAWAVQVASFARAANAEDFRARLREDGYEAFISTAKSDSQVLSRVAVGPLLDRQRGETLRRELSARYDVEARLMAFSN